MKIKLTSKGETWSHGSNCCFLFALNINSKSLMYRNTYTHVNTAHYYSEVN